MTELERYFARELVHGSAFYPVGSLPVQADRVLDVTSGSLS
jgi:hypothetical protein